MLYDPNKAWPQHCGREMPEFLERIATFKPTHLRILSYNTQSGNVHVRLPPTAWKGKTVEYTAYGPQLIDLPRPKRPTSMTENSRMSFADTQELYEIRGRSTAAATPSEVSSTETVAAESDSETNRKTGANHTKGTTIIAKVKENVARYSATDKETVDSEP